MNLSRRTVLAGLAGASLTPVLPAIPSFARRAGTELRENFAGVADGPASAISQTGQAMTNYPGSGAGQPWVRGGFLTARYPRQFEGGCYRIARLTNAVNEVGATFALTPSSMPGGLLCLSIQMGNIGETSPSVPVSPMHFWIDANRWNLDVNTEAGTDVDYVASGTFSTPLVADGATIYGMGVLLDRAAQTCTLWLPDGQVVTVSDPRFDRGGRYVYVEPFKSLGNSDLKSAALVREWWANS